MIDARALRWCVYQTHPQAERLAARELTRAGYRSYCPLIAAQRRDPVIRSMSHRVLVPRFPGYGFVELGAGDRWVPIKDTAGIAKRIAKLILNDGRPATLPADEIERHMADDEALCDLTPETLPHFEPGTPIRIEDGAFIGFRGTVIECDGVMTTIEIEMPFACLRRATARPKTPPNSTSSPRLWRQPPDSASLSCGNARHCRAPARQASCLSVLPWHRGHPHRPRRQALRERLLARA